MAINSGLTLFFIFWKLQGTGVVHLTGYNVQEDEGPSMMYEPESDSESEEETEVPALVNGKKRKATSGDESSPTAKKKSKKDEKIEPNPKAKEEKKQAVEMAKKIADTIKVS